VTRRTIGIVDYGMNNLASVWRVLHGLGYRCRVSNDPAALDEADLLLLPGVGAFPAAMNALHELGLTDYLRNEARSGRPLVGICLGMQLMADVSSEYKLTEGLGLVPGRVEPFADGRWHIGWNSVELVHEDALLRPSDGRSFYFNHSFVFRAPPEYLLGVARLEQPIPTVIRRNNIVGLQFHPEKSQHAGRELLRNVIEGLCRD
jgi:imidazole glycerol-phosphate synthase subunit HisH